MSLLSDIIISDTATISNEFGDIVKIIKCGEKGISKIREVYCSWVVPNKTKAWKKQENQTIMLFVLLGTIRFVFIDSNEKVLRIDIRSDSKKLLIIPPGIWYGFKCISNDNGLILNSTDITHDPDAVIRRDTDYFPSTYFTDEI